ncbi:MAG: substrate-binding domain-containing protein [Paucibacter sp.]|nr:substrate-binding domain-containing protein [Roseateles sp.]
MFPRVVAVFASLVWLVGIQGADAHADEIKVLCANGMRAVLTELRPQLERAVGQEIALSFDEAGVLRKRILNGESVDLVVLPRVVLDKVLADGNVVKGTLVDLAQSPMGLGVRADAAKPNITSADALRQAFLAAKSIAITDPALGGVSGPYIIEVFKRLGITEQVGPKLKLNNGGSNSEFIARGEADMAAQPKHEILAVPGVQFIPLPAEFERTFVFSAALASRAGNTDSAKTILHLLVGPQALEAIQAKGMDLIASK